MTRDKIQQLAKEAGLPLAYISANGVLNWSDLERFTALVLEEAALKFDQPHKEYFGDDIQLTIRALKPEA
jgi:hypothetical protein